MKQEWQSFYLLKFCCKDFNIPENVLASQVFCLYSSTSVAKLHPRKYNSYLTDRLIYIKLNTCMSPHNHTTIFTLKNFGHYFSGFKN